MRTAGIAVLSLGLALAGGTGRVWSQTSITFEPPTYAVGPLVGQNGWVKNAYTGTPNGTVSISNAAPITGAQSLVYTQTSPGAFPNFADVGRAGGILAPAIQGIDLSVSYTIEGTTGVEPVYAGLFLGNGAPGGASPILAWIRGGIVEFGSAGAFVPVNSFFFLDGERIKMTYELDFDTGNMNLLLENLTFPSGTTTVSGPFFAGYGGPTGANGEYNVDLGLFLRGGNVKIDDITATLGVGPVVTDFEWTANASGNWNQTGNWTPVGVPGTVPGRQKATLGSAITESRIIYNNAARNLNELEINNAFSYIVAGTGSLTFQSDASGPTTIAPVINVLAGAHQIQLQVELNNSTTVTVASGASLDFNNQIDLNGNTLTLSGVVRLNHSTIGGGTVMSVGALVSNGSASIGGNLVSTGETVIGIDADGADAFYVAGDATLSGVLDVDWDPATITTSPMTIVSASGSLDATSLALSADDAGLFSLAASGSDLVLTYLGVATPEPASVAMLAMGLGLVAARRRRFVRPLATAAMMVAVVAVSRPASAVVYNFENPPYNTGDLVGQQGWVTPGYVLADPFFGGVINGTVVVSGSSPLVGSQSALYTQTVDPPSAGNTGASDVSRASAVFAVEDGTTAIDLTASFQVKANNNGVGNGSAGFFLGRQGQSPIFLLLTDANSTAGTGSMIIGDNGTFGTFPYVPNNTYEFTFGVDVDNGNFEVTQRNITAGTPVQTLTGSGPGGRFVFLSPYASDGDAQTYTFDTTMVFRSGEARLDAVTAVGDDFTEALWGGGSGSWASNASWIPNMIPNVATGNSPIAVFGSRIISPQTVFTGATQTVNGLRFDNANKYAIAGGGAVTLKANTIGGTVNPTINVVTGAHEMQVAVNILDNTAITVASGADLDFNNNIALGGKTLSTSGAVDINYGVTGGGTITNSGILGTAGATPIAANLTSTGTLRLDLGPANVDRFNITGTATLSGLIDIVLEPGYTPSGPITLLTSTGALSTTGLALDPSDSASYSLSVSGNSLLLNLGGVAIPGDFNNNGVVNGADLTIWRSAFGSTTAGNADGDGDSDGNDFLIWQRNLTPGAATPVATNVPEPAAGMLLAVALLAAAGVAQRGRKSRK